MFLVVFIFFKGHGSTTSFEERATEARASDGHLQTRPFFLGGGSVDAAISHLKELAALPSRLLWIPTFQDSHHFKINADKRQSATFFTVQKLSVNWSATVFEEAQSKTGFCFLVNNSV